AALLEHNLIGALTPRNVFHTYRRMRAPIKNLTRAAPLRFPYRTESLDPFQLADNPLLVCDKKRLNLTSVSCYWLYHLDASQPDTHSPFPGGFRADKSVLHLPPAKVDTMQCRDFHGASLAYPS